MKVLTAKQIVKLIDQLDFDKGGVRKGTVKGNNIYDTGVEQFKLGKGDEQRVFLLITNGVDEDVWVEL